MILVLHLKHLMIAYLLILLEVIIQSPKNFPYYFMNYFITIFSLSHPFCSSCICTAIHCCDSTFDKKEIKKGGLTWLIAWWRSPSWWRRHTVGGMTQSFSEGNMLTWGASKRQGRQSIIFSLLPFNYLAMVWCHPWPIYSSSPV